MKLRFEQNKIVDEDIKKVYDISNVKDMKDLCHKVNEEIQDLTFIIDDYKVSYNRIKKFLETLEL